MDFYQWLSEIKTGDGDQFEAPEFNWNRQGFNKNRLDLFWPKQQQQQQPQQPQQDGLESIEFMWITIGTGHNLETAWQDAKEEMMQKIISGQYDDAVEEPDGSNGIAEEPGTLPHMPSLDVGDGEEFKKNFLGKDFDVAFFMHGWGQGRTEEECLKQAQAHALKKTKMNKPDMYQANDIEHRPDPDRETGWGDDDHIGRGDLDYE